MADQPLPEWAQAHDPDDLWLGECGCVHLLVGADCPCEPETRWDDEGPYMFHHCEHTDERVEVHGR